jgi:hypothetical protein
VRRSKAFGDSVALTFESEARGRSPCAASAIPKTHLRPCASGSVHSAVKNRHREKHYGCVCRRWKHQHELDLRST